MFYGVGISAVEIANARIAIESVRKLVTEYTGVVVSGKFNNRVLRAEHIKLRCEAQRLSSICCKYLADSDEYTYGYGLPSSYSAENSGTIVIKLQNDDGNSPPNGQALGKTQPYVPMEIMHKQFPSIAFEASIPIELGKPYQLVFKNLIPPTQCVLMATIA